MEPLLKLWITVLEALGAVVPLVVVLLGCVIVAVVTVVVGVKLFTWLDKDDEPPMGLPKSYTKDDIVGWIKELRTLPYFPVPPGYPSSEDKEPRVALVIPSPCELVLHGGQTEESVLDSKSDFNECRREVDGMSYGEAIDLVVCYHFNLKQSQKRVEWLREHVKFLESELKENKYNADK